MTPPHLVSAIGSGVSLMISLWKKGKAKSLEMNACKARLRRACLLSQDSEDKHGRNLARAILKDWEALLPLPGCVESMYGIILLMLWFIIGPANLCPF